MHAAVGQGEEAVASPATRQAALVTFGALAQYLGPAAPGPVAGAAPAVLAAFDDPHRCMMQEAVCNILCSCHHIHAADVLA